MLLKVLQWFFFFLKEERNVIIKKVFLFLNLAERTNAKWRCRAFRTKVWEKQLKKTVKI